MLPPDDFMAPLEKRKTIAAERSLGSLASAIKAGATCHLIALRVPIATLVSTSCVDAAPKFPCVTISTRDFRGHFVSGQPLSFADGNALLPGTMAICL
jgi:hypothetical protein